MSNMTDIGQAKIRTYRAIFRVSLDKEGDDIKLGVFGDLSMGDRYALGVVARSKTAEAEVNRVGALARALVAQPFTYLRARHDEIWSSDNPRSTFEATVSASHTSLIFCGPTIATRDFPIFQYGEKLPNATEVKAWCITELRRELVERYEEWFGMPHDGRPDGRDEMRETVEFKYAA